MAITDANVKAVIETSRDTTPQIATATLFVAEELSGSTLSAARLEQITIYLAAHFVAIADQILSRERMGEAEDTYKQPSDFDQGLSASLHGQTAMLLDTTGKLAALATNKGLKAKFDILSDRSHGLNGNIPWSIRP